ncbi:dephospho-CoA kinase [Winogradskyella sp. DF17]|uniref:Dephospho-CoA kinase n=1 Tax=Winogradskyella pelagia TaxID=2819984 RepID=A0ABS3T3P0_9FLAO|nr:dephospho-CoA kinase [Winogradskyella sp. DF17]MBO3117365.1 dephospho-CoA kinase [Winogradskyella sp. DF17]
MSKPKIIGLTGGIGSGKSTVASFFKAVDIPVYIADDEAKALMNRSKIIKRKLISFLGHSAYKDGVIDRAYIAKRVFADKALLEKINAIVHPKVASHFKRWVSKQDSPYIIKEAAIIFENNLEAQYDKIITVVSPMEKRIKRVMKRDGTKREKVLSIINNQLSDDEKIDRSDFVIYNNDLKSLEAQVKEIHKQLLTKP